METNDLSIKIKKACQAKGINIQELAGKAGVNMSASGLYASLANNTMKVSILLAIAEELEIPVMDLLHGGDKQEGIKIDELKDKVNKCIERVKMLEEKLEDKTRIIELSDGIIKKNEQVITYLNEQTNNMKYKYKDLQENFRNIDGIIEEPVSAGEEENTSENKFKLLKKEISELRIKISDIISL